MFSKEMEIGIVGGGHIGFAIGSALIQKGVVVAKDLYVSCPHLESLEKWSKIGAHVTTDNGVVVRNCSIIFICVEPNVVRKCALQIEMSVDRIACRSDKLLLSVSTGVTLDALMVAFSFLRKTKMVRVVLNTPVQFGEGSIAYAPGDRIRTDNLEKIQYILGSLGIAIQVPEQMMDALTALISCGTAYVFSVINSMADGANKLHVPDALPIAAQTALGSAKLVLQTGKHPAILRDECYSSMGPCIHGVHELEKCNLRSGIMLAIDVATEKNIELGHLRKQGSDDF